MMVDDIGGSMITTLFDLPTPLQGHTEQKERTVTKIMTIEDVE